MKIHRQSPVEMRFDTKTDDFIGYRPRNWHYGVAVGCPREDCDARPGGECRVNGHGLGPLAVHHERAEAAISS